MAHSSSKKAARSVPVPGLVIVVVLLVGFAGWVSHKSLSPERLEAAPVVSLDPRHTWIEDMARKAQGDINNLSPAERDQVMQVSRGWGVQVLKSEWANMKH